jgi:hypothetical protein
MFRKSLSSSSGVVMEEAPGLVMEEAPHLAMEEGTSKTTSKLKLPTTRYAVSKF